MKKKLIKQAIKKASKYQCIRNPIGQWCCILFDENDNGFLTIEYYKEKDKKFIEELLYKKEIENGRN